MGQRTDASTPTAAFVGKLVMKLIGFFTWLFHTTFTLGWIYDYDSHSATLEVLKKHVTKMSLKLPQLPHDVLLSITSFLPIARDRAALGSACASLRSAMEKSLFSCVRCSSETTDADAMLLASRFGRHVRRLRFECLILGNALVKYNYNEDDDEDDDDDIYYNNNEDDNDKEDDNDNDNDNDNEDDSDNEDDNDNDNEDDNDIDEDDSGGNPEKVFRKIQDTNYARSTQLDTTVAALLRGELLPNMNSLVVVFSAHWPRSDYVSWYRSETWDNAAEAEEVFQWRRLVASMWRNIAANPFIRSLEIVSLPPIRNTAWADAAWPSFVGRLERLSIGICSHYGGVVGSVGSSAYGDFLRQHLTTVFFVNARNLLSLEILADERIPYGGVYIKSALGISNMPHLKDLSLHNCGIDVELLEFLRSHSHVIKSLHLVQCTAAALRLDKLTWAAFFNGMSASHDPVLSEITRTREYVKCGKI
ncbi:hypothetical protein HK405_014527 [Cladochytrium tenue]|nr:hypothetical protein HK405_014527 [Cladochytrium tenue]